jgi:hypothetical protein
MYSHFARSACFHCGALWVGLFLVVVCPLAAQTPGMQKGSAQGVADLDSDADCDSAQIGSPYIPVDSWIYPAVLRLYALGYIDTVYLGMRPWTRVSVSNMLENTGEMLANAESDSSESEAEGLYDALTRELREESRSLCPVTKGAVHVESAYSVMRAMSGTPLRDSYHLGSTIINDYGRPYSSGFNNYTGASGYASAGRFVLYLRGEFQGAPSATGYSSALAQALSTVDGTTFLNPVTGKPYSQATIPMGPITARTEGRFLEAYVSGQFLNHVFSLGKQDDWLGPGLGGAMAYSNNAENIYSFRINRIEPLDIPLLSRLTGPFRYEFLIGGLRGHTYMPPDAANDNLIVNPGDPWVHVEKISFRPTENLEFGFERTTIFGGHGHGAINLKRFLKSFFSFASPAPEVKQGPDDPGARFGSFDFSYRVPFVRNWLTLYADSEVHDDVSPIDAPRRAAYRPGLYLSHVPGLPKLDIRVEAVSTDPNAATDVAKPYGHFMYWEYIQRQGYTNQGQLIGDWIGREDKGGQGWITYHLSGNEWIQVGVRNQKATKDFIPSSTTQTYFDPNCPASTCLLQGGTTLNDINFQVVKRIGKDFEINGSFSHETWKAPIYLPGAHGVSNTSIRLTWYPNRNVTF